MKLKTEARIVKIKKQAKPNEDNDIERDSKRKALPCGVRISKAGNQYQETRFNRCDTNLKKKL